MEHITVEKVYPIFQNNYADDIFIDIRDIDEWGDDAIVGFRHIPLSELISNVYELKTYYNIYVLCQDGEKSAKACEFLSLSGCAEVMSIKGGLDEWRKVYS